MNSMTRHFLLPSLLSFAVQLQAQEIHYEPVLERAYDAYAAQTPRVIGHCTDSLRTDTVYTEDLSTGSLEMQVQKYPFARYEFYLDGALYRRIDITQVEDTREVGWKVDRFLGDTVGVIASVVNDIPNGAYHEFFPNGNIRIMGRLDGFNADGTLKKVGEWREWDAQGQVILREEHPE